MPLAVYTLGLAIFSLGTVGLMVTGMITTLSEVFGATVGEVGYLILYYTFGVILGGPVLIYTFLKFKASYRSTLLWLLGLYVTVQELSVSVSDYNVLAAIRVMTGILCAECLSLSLATSMALVPVENRPRAASVVIAGFMVSNVFGVPTATIIDQYWGWKMSFGLVTVLIFICLLVLVHLLPHMSGGGVIKMAGEIEAFKNKAYRKACATSCLILGASFVAFSCFASVLTDVSEFTMQTVPFTLMLYGLANIIGNMATGRPAHRRSSTVMIVGLTTLSISLLGMTLFVQYQVIALLAVILTGLSGVPINPAMMARIVSVAHPGPMVNAAHTFVTNIGLGGGSYLGGMAISSGFGLCPALWAEMVLMALASLSVLPYIRHSKQGWS